MTGDIVMVKKYKQRLALWIFSVFLLAVLLPGCGRQNAPGKEAASLQERADIAALRTDGEAEETLPVKAAETEIIGSDETKSVQAGGGETEYPETGEDEIRTPDAVNAGTESADSESNGSSQAKKDGQPVGEGPQDESGLSAEDGLPDEAGSYTSKDEVALYLYTYGHLPDNFITKNEAKKLGWDNSKGNLAKVAPGKSIGGDRFGNYEGLLPEKDGRKWTECDIGYEEGYRYGERFVFSNDGLIYYSGDHYKSFEQLY